MASLDDLTCDIDMIEDPEWADRFMLEHLGGVTSASEPGPHKDISAQDNTGWLDQMSPNTLEYVLAGLGALMPSPSNVIEQTGGGAIDNSMPPPTILVNNKTSSSSNNDTATSQVPPLPDFFLSSSALHHTKVYSAKFGDLFNSLVSGDIITDPSAITHLYTNKIRAILEQQMGVWGVGVSLKASIALKIFFLMKM